MRDNPNALAFTYGPVALSAGLGTAQVVTSHHALTIAATKRAGMISRDTITIGIASDSGTGIEDRLANTKSNLVQSPASSVCTLKGHRLR